jgi:hypothetical protein
MEKRQSYAEVRVGSLSVVEKGHLRGVDLVLSKGGILEGVARNADGSSASHVEIWSEGKTSLGWSDEEGHFELVGVDPGRHSIRARSRRGMVSAAVEVEIEAGERRQVELELVAGTIVRVSVSKDGQRVGAEMGVVDAGGRPQVVQTRENGEASVGPLLPGRYSVRARRDGKEVQREFEVGDGVKEQSVEIVFE